MKILVSNITDSGVYRVRKELLTKLILDGHEIIVVAPEGQSVERIKELGCHFVPLSINGHGMNPIDDFRVFLAYRRLIKRFRPEVVLTYTIKPNIYCGMAARFSRIPYIPNVTGLGTALASSGIKQTFLVKMCQFAYQKAACIFFQNSSNMAFFEKNRIGNPNCYCLIPGSGVNLNDFPVLPYPSEDNGIHFLFVSRILKEKGIDNYIQAARIVKERNSNVFFHILGAANEDYDALLKEADKDGIIVYHGHVNNVRDYQLISHCTIHPSYYPEGMSNVLLEAAASGRPVITTDHPGCRETVENGQNGFIVRVNDTGQLADSIMSFLALSYEQKKQMGLYGRKKMEKEFNRDIIVARYVNVINKINKRY